MKVQMTCMTTKQKFDVDDPPVVMLRNGRYAYKCECPWRNPKNNHQLYAYKFCSTEAYKRYIGMQEELEEVVEEQNSDASG